MLKVVGLLTLVSVASAALYRWDPQAKPADFAYQPGCYLSHLHRALQYNVYFYPNTDCARYLCLPGSNETLYETCAAVKVRPGCRLTAVDLRSSYPYCCGREVCDVTTTTQAPTTTTQAPTTTTQAPTTTTQAPTTPTTQVPTTPTTQVPTTPTTQGPTTPTTQVPTTPTTQSPTTSTTQNPTTPTTQGPNSTTTTPVPSKASASASSVSGQPPKTQVASSGPNAHATATAS